MRAFPQACRTVAAILFPLAVLSCRDTGGPTGTGRTAPTAAALAVAPLFAEDSGEPVIPLRQARIRLFRLPGQTPEVAVLDTLVPFGEGEDERAVTLGVTLTMANERFGMELALLDDRSDVVYLGRDTVIAYTSGKPPAAKPLRLRYAGPDTAVARIALAPRDTVLAIGDALTLRAAAFLRDGRPTTARFGFAVHGSSAVSVDQTTGVLRARTLAAARTTWVVVRTATGLVDSVAVATFVPARTIGLTPESGRVTVGKSVVLAAVVRDSAGSPLADREVTWSSSDPSVATVTAGKVTGVGAGSAEITATADRASASAVVTVFPGGAARVLPSVVGLLLEPGDEAGVSALVLDALGEELAGGTMQWSIGDAGIASVTPAPGNAAMVTVRGAARGTTTLVATIDGVTATIGVEVRRPPAVRVTIAPRSGTLRVGEILALSASAFDARNAAVPASEIGWRSLSPSVATVDTTGVVRALSTGHARIVASVDGVSDDVTIDVQP